MSLGANLLSIFVPSYFLTVTIKKNIRISTINMGAEANINLCMKIDHGCSLYARILEYSSNVNNAKKPTIGNSIKSKTIFFHLSFFGTIWIA